MFTVLETRGMIGEVLMLFLLVTLKWGKTLGVDRFSVAQQHWGPEGLKCSRLLVLVQMKRARRISPDPIREDLPWLVQERSPISTVSYGGGVSQWDILTNCLCRVPFTPEVGTGNDVTPELTVFLLRSRQTKMDAFFYQSISPVKPFERAHFIYK